MYSILLFKQQNLIFSNNNQSINVILNFYAHVLYSVVFHIFEFLSLFRAFWRKWVLNLRFTGKQSGQAVKNLYKEMFMFWISLKDNFHFQAEHKINARDDFFPFRRVRNNLILIHEHCNKQILLYLYTNDNIN